MRGEVYRRDEIVLRRNTEDQLSGETPLSKEMSRTSEPNTGKHQKN